MKVRVNKESSHGKNWAVDREFAQHQANHAIRDWLYLRAQRSEREFRWQDAYDQWSIGNQDPINTRNYSGRGNRHWPQLRKEVETMSRRLVKATFPEDYLKADPSIINVDKDLAIENALVTKHYLSNVMHIKQKAMPWIKQGVLYGTSPLRSAWKKEVNEMFFRKRWFDTGPNGELIPSFKKVKENVTIYDAPTVWTADMFQTWVYPSTAETPEDIERVYHRRKIQERDLLLMIKQGISIDIMDELKDVGKETDEQFDQTQVRLQALGDSGELQGHHQGRYYDLLEIWGKTETPDGKFTNYVQYIINENPSWCIRFQQNPFWFQKPNFNWMRYIIAPTNEFYARGLPEAIISMQYQLDDTVEQGMDSTTLALNQITIVNPTYAPNVDSFEIEPNAIWWADPNAVKPFTFPDISDIYIKNAQFIRSVISEMSDNQPQLPDPLQGKARSTGQADLAMDEWQTDLYTFAEQIIIEGLLPLAQDVHALLQQNVSDDAIINVSGKYGGEWVNRIVTPSQLVGRYQFNWMGAVQIENQSVKTQQMLQFLKLVPLFGPDLKLDVGALVMEILRNGFNFKFPEQFIGNQKDNDSMDPYIENKIMDQGGKVEVSSFDDDEAHLQSHLQEASKTTDPYKRALLQYHINKHTNQIKSKQAQAALQAQQQTIQTAQAMHQPEGSRNKTGIMQRPAPNPNGNQGQIPNTVDVASMNKGIRP